MADRRRVTIRERVNSRVKTPSGAKICVFTGVGGYRGRESMVCVSAVLGLDLGKASRKVHFNMVKIVTFGAPLEDEVGKKCTRL